MRAEMILPDELNVLNENKKKNKLDFIFNDQAMEVIFYGIEKSLVAWNELLATVSPKKVSIRMVDYQVINAKEFLQSRLTGSITTFSFEETKEKGKHLFILDEKTFGEINDHLKVEQQSSELKQEQLNELLNHFESGVKLFYRRFSEELNITMNIKALSALDWATKEEMINNIELDDLFEIKIYEAKVENNSFFMMHLSDMDFMNHSYAELKKISHENLLFEGLVDETNFSENQSNTFLNSNSAVSTTNIKKPLFSNFEESAEVEGNHNLDLLYDVPLEISVVLGKTKRSIRDILEINTGKIIELEKYADDPLEIYCNGKMIAEGEVVVVGENFGVRVTKLHQNGLKKVNEKR